VVSDDCCAGEIATQARARLRKAVETLLNSLLIPLKSSLFFDSSNDNLNRRQAAAVLVYINDPDETVTCLCNNCS
jgi:hypothetical protein